MSDNKRIAKNTLFLYIRMFLIMGVSFYTSRVVLRVLGVEDFGLYNIIGGVVTLFAVLNGSLGAATSRFITFELGRKDHEQLNKIFNAALVTHVFIALIIIMLAETVGLCFFYEKMTIPENRLNAAFWVYQISIITCFFSLTQVPYNATIIAYENMKIYAYVGLVEVIARLLVVYALSFSPIDKLVFYALLLCAVQIGIMLYYRYYCNKCYHDTCKIKLCAEKQLYKSMFNYAGSDMIGQVSVLAQGQGLNLLLNVFFGPVVNASRGIAYQVQAAITQFGNNFITAVRPQIIKLYAEGKPEEMMILVRHSSCFSYYLMWFISFPICLEAPYILSLWLVNYPPHTVNFLILTIVLCLIQTIKTPRTTVFHATGNLKLANMVVGGILCAAFPIAYIVLKLGGHPESVFWIANVTMLISEFASVFILKKYVRFSIPNYLLNVHGRCLLVTAVSFVIPYLIYDRIMDEGFFRLMTTIVLTSVSVAVASFTLGIDKNMRARLIVLFRKKVMKNGSYHIV